MNNTQSAIDLLQSEIRSTGFTSASIYAAIEGQTCHVNINRDGLLLLVSQLLEIIKGRGQVNEFVLDEAGIADEGSCAVVFTISE